MIKQIQLRGISRTPSDRLSEDGGLSESLNMYLDTAENAPAFVPEEVTEKLGLPADLQAERIFIHKTANYENYIVVQEGRIVAYTPGIEDEEPLLVMELAEGEIVNDITSVGNTLIVSSANSLYYILYKERKYSFLGENVPFPIIEFFDVRTELQASPKVLDYNLKDVSTSIATQYLNPKDSIISENGCSAIGALYHYYGGSSPDNTDYVRIGFYEHMWNEVDEHGNNTNTDVLSAISSIQGLYDKMKEENRKLSVFTNPVWACYAIRLFNDSLLVSSPQLISPGEEPIELCGFGGFVLGYGQIILRIDHFYKLGVRIVNTNGIDGDQWKDIVKGIEIFISEDINRFDFSGITIEERESFQSEYSANVQFARFKIKGKDLSFIKDALNKSTFANVESFYLDENFYPDGTLSYTTILSDYTLDSRAYIDNAQRMSRKKLSDFSYSMEKLIYKAKSLDVYNNRLMLTGSSFQYPKGPEWLSAQRYNTFLPRAFVKQNASLDDIIAAIPSWWLPELDGTGASATKQYDIAINIGTTSSDAVVYGYNPYKVVNRYDDLVPIVYSLVLYPSSDCQSIYIQSGGKIKKREMYAHPTLPKCSYYYENTTMDEGLADGSLPMEFNMGDGTYYIRLANSENPLFIESSIKFQSKVIGVAVATTTLSQGQFGQFPLYVFTEGGIWAMETGADGSFVSQKPLSREVCINPDSICSIDNAVVFVTSKAVMMIQGSQVMNISPYMNGRHYTPNESALNIIGKQDGYDTFVDVISDDDPFMSFMKDAKVAYDYTGQRLVFISPSNNGFQYVYKIDTQTWHKVAFEGLDLEAPLNSYPECLVNSINGREYKYEIKYKGESLLASDEAIKSLIDDLDDWSGLHKPSSVESFKENWQESWRQKPRIVKYAVPADNPIRIYNRHGFTTETLDSFDVGIRRISWETQGFGTVSQQYHEIFCFMLNCNESELTEKLSSLTDVAYIDLYVRLTDETGEDGNRVWDADFIAALDSFFTAGYTKDSRFTAASHQGATFQILGYEGPDFSSEVINPFK